MLNAEQVAKRADALGSSDIPRVCGVVPYQGSAPIDVWLEKTGLEPPRPGNHRTELGHILEPHIYNFWKAEQKSAVADGASLGTVRDRTLEWLVATPDHVPRVGRKRKIVECKFVGADVARSHWRDAGVVPDYVALQVQIQMRVLRIYDAEVAVWLEGVRDDQARRIVPIPYDPRAVATALVIAERFWFDCVVAGQPPEIDGSSTWARLLKQSFPRDTAPVADAPPAADAIVAAYQTASADVKDAETRKATAKHQLLSLIGERAGIRNRKQNYCVTWRADRNGDRSIKVKEYGRGF